MTTNQEMMEPIHRLKAKLEGPLKEKNLFDHFVEFYRPVGFERSLWPRRPVLDPSTFITAAIPFSLPKAEGDEYVDSVSPYNVLGGNYVWDEKYDHCVELKIIDRLEKGSITAGIDRVDYVKIGNFDIYIPNEGKNRVSLYRRHNKKITGWITPSKYPNIQDLKLINLMPFGVPGLLLQDHPNGDYFDNIGVYIPHKNGVIAILAFNESVEFFQRIGVQRGGKVMMIDAAIRAARIRQYIPRAILKR